MYTNNSLDTPPICNILKDFGLSNARFNQFDHLLVFSLFFLIRSYFAKLFILRCTTYSQQWALPSVGLLQLLRLY